MTMLLDALSLAFQLSPIAVSLAVLTIAFGLGMGIGKLYVRHLERKMARHCR